MAQLEGRVAVVTGAARGIGLAAAQALAKAGANVLIVDIDGSEAKQAASNSGVRWMRADVSKRADAKKIATKARALGGMDILINNAATFFSSTPFADISERQWSTLVQTNLEGPLICVQAALPLLEQSACASVVNISSTLGLRAQPDSAPYCSAKGGLVNLTRAMAVDLAPQGVRVNCIAPGFIDTRMAIKADGTHEHEDAFFRRHYIRGRRIPLGRAGQPEDVAGAIVFFAGDNSRYITGQTLAVDGGLLSTY